MKYSSESQSLLLCTFSFSVASWELSPMWMAWNIVIYPLNFLPSLYFWVGQINGMLNLDINGVLSPRQDLEPFLLTWSPFHCLAMLTSVWPGFFFSFGLFLAPCPSDPPPMRLSQSEPVVSVFHCPGSGTISLCQESLNQKSSQISPFDHGFLSPLPLCLWSLSPHLFPWTFPPFLLSVASFSSCLLYPYALSSLLPRTLHFWATDE